jgi:hypothetical protein
MRERWLRGLLCPALSAGLFLLLVAASARATAEDTGRSVKTEGEFVAYDAEAKKVTIKVTRPGIGALASALASGQRVDFRVQPEGSVLSRTTVAIEGVKAGLADISAGRTVNVYWRPDESDPGGRFARKIDVILTDAELDERYGAE